MICFTLYQVNNLFLHQSYLKTPLPVKLTWKKCKKSFFIIGKFKKYRKCPALCWSLCSQNSRGCPACRQSPAPWRWPTSCPPASRAQSTPWESCTGPCWWQTRGTWPAGNRTPRGYCGAEATARSNWLIIRQVKSSSIDTHEGTYLQQVIASCLFLQKLFKSNL